MNAYIGMMMDEFEEDDRVRRANDLAIARMLWDDAAAIPREFVTSGGTAPIAQGSSRTAAALSAFRGGDDIVDDSGAPATRVPTQNNADNHNRVRFFISRAPLMVGPEDPIIDDGYGHPSMDDVGRIYEGNNPIQVAAPTAGPPVVQALIPQTGSTMAPPPFPRPFVPPGQHFPVPQRPIDQPWPPLPQSSSGVPSANPWQHSQHTPLSMPGILSISAPNHIPQVNAPRMASAPTASLERTHTQAQPPALPSHRPEDSILHQIVPPRIGLNYPNYFPHEGRSTPPVSAAVPNHAQSASSQPQQWPDNRNSFGPLRPQPIALETNASIPNNGSSSALNPALDPYTIMFRNANQTASLNATNDPFSQLFDNPNNPINRTHQNTNTTTFAPTMWGTPLFPQPPVPTPVQAPPMPPTPIPLPPPIIRQPSNSGASAPAQHPAQPPAQPPVQHPAQFPTQPQLQPTMQQMQHPMQHMQYPMQPPVHPMQPPAQPAQPNQNPQQTNLPAVPLPPQIIPETTNRTTPQTPQLTSLPPRPPINTPAPTTITPRPPPPAPYSQERPSHTPISQHNNQQRQSTEQPLATAGVRHGKSDFSALIAWLPLLGIGGLVFYAFSNVGVLILAGVIVWYTYWVPASKGEKK